MLQSKLNAQKARQERCRAHRSYGERLLELLERTLRRHRERRFEAVLPHAVVAAAAVTAAAVFIVVSVASF